MAHPKMHGRTSWSFLWGEKQEHRGITLRSKLEYRFVKAIEARDGLTLGESLLYEPRDMRVEYVDPENGRKRRYWPDFIVPGANIVYEVKHIGRAGTALQEAKRSAFEQAHPDIRYVLVTERDVGLMERELLTESDD